MLKLLRPLSFTLLFCLALSIRAHAAGFQLGPAGRIVQRFCELDARGTFASSRTWPKIKEFAVWSDGPGWDKFYYIKAFRIIREDRSLQTLILDGAVTSQEEAEVQVEYDYLGESSGQTLHKYQKKEIVKFKLRKENQVWKIYAPQLPPHLYLRETQTKRVLRVI